MRARTACLDRLAVELDVLVEVLTRSDTRTVDNAVHAAVELTPLATCIAPKTAQGAVPPPGIRREVKRLERQLARVQALNAVGKPRDATELGAKLVGAAKRLGFRPLHVKTLLAQAKSVRRSAGGNDAGAQLFREAWIQAKAAGMLREQAIAQAALVFIVGYLQGKRDEAELLARHARATLHRLGGDKQIESRLLSALAVLAYENGDADAAVEQKKAAITIALEAQVDDPRAVFYYSNLGYILRSLGRYQQAFAAFASSIELGKKTVGPNHPRLAHAYGNMATTLVLLGRYREAEASYHQALSLYRTAGLTEHRLALITTSRLARLRARQGRFAEARALAERARAGTKRVFGSNHLRVASMWLVQAFVERLANDFSGARALYQRFLAREQSMEGPRGTTHAGLMVDALLGMGQCSLGLGNPRAALPPLERVNRLQIRNPHRLAAVQFALAEALARLGRNPKRALALAQGARARLHDASDPLVLELRSRIVAWLAKARKPARSSAPPEGGGG